MSTEAPDTIDASIDGGAEDAESADLLAPDVAAADGPDTPHDDDGEHDAEVATSAGNDDAVAGAERVPGSRAGGDGSHNPVLLARMESRLRAIEDALERSVSRQQELDRRHASEVDLIRARLDDTLDVMTDTLQRSRAVQAETQQRISHLLAASERTTRSYVDDLRSELTPRVTRTQSQIESMQNRLAGELEAFTEEARSRMAQMEDLLRHAENREDRTQTMLDDQVEELRNFAIRRLMETSQAMQEQREQQLALADEMRERVGTVEASQSALKGLSGERVDELANRVLAVENDLGARIDETRQGLTERVDTELRRTDERLDALATDLDARTDALAGTIDGRAHEVAARLDTRIDDLAQEHERVLASLRSDVVGRLEDVEERSDSLRAEVLSRLDGVEAGMESSLESERAARQEVERRVDERVQELIETTTEVRGLVGSGEVRLRGELEQLAQRVDAVTGTVDGLQEQVAAAVGTVASRLSNEVATIGGDLDALRDIVRGLESRAAAVDQHRRRLDLLDEQITETARIARNVNQAVLGAVQRHRANRDQQAEPVPVSHSAAVIADVADQVQRGDADLGPGDAAGAPHAPTRGPDAEHAAAAADADADDATTEA